MLHHKLLVIFRVDQIDQVLILLVEKVMELNSTFNESELIFDSFFFLSVRVLNSHLRILRLSTYSQEVFLIQREYSADYSVLEMI